MENLPDDVLEGSELSYVPDFSVSPEDERQSFLDRAIKLLDDACAVGYSGCVLLSAYDPFTKGTSSVVTRRGNYYAIVGMLRDYEKELPMTTIPVGTSIADNEDDDDDDE